MNQKQAEARYWKLRELADPARGGTPAERRVADAKARDLADRFHLNTQRETPRERVSGVSSGTAGYRVWTAARAGPVTWSFNFKTGEHSDNVHVHWHRGPANWKIEINEPRTQPRKKPRYQIRDQDEIES